MNMHLHRLTSGRFGGLRDSALGPGVLIILALALLSSGLMAIRGRQTNDGLVMWTRARNHLLLYEPVVAKWNRASPDERHVSLYLMSDLALERRMLSSFFSETHLADLVELERNLVGRVFAAGPDEVGFVDLTDRLRDSGLDTRINPASFSAWSAGGRVFGLPHDVHPVLLAYRSDIVEQAGIDMTSVATWDDFERRLGPLVADLDGDGLADRYLINFWHTNSDLVELLVLQAGGAYFDSAGRPVIDSDVNAETLARLAAWVCGPRRIAIDAPEFQASGNQLRLEGQVVCSFVPDWLCGVWRDELPQLSGKIKLRPLPAWRPGGRRTSVWGGSMLGIPKTTKRLDDAWSFACHLYLSPEIAERLYRSTGIISPVTDIWAGAFYDEPDPYFNGQAPGRMYIEQAPNVPLRSSSPYNKTAKDRVRDALVRLRRHAMETEVFSRRTLVEEARVLLAGAQRSIREEIGRNVFLKTGE